MAQGQIKIGIGFNVNKASLNQVKQAIKELKEMSKDQIEAAGGSILPISKGVTKSWKNDLGEMRKELDALGKAMETAFNPKFGTYELNKFNESLKMSGTNAEHVFQVVSAYGNQGSAVLLNMTTSMLATDRVAKQVHSTFQKLGETMMNTIRWSITSSAINMVTGAIQSAYNYAVDLDQSLNDIMIVTDKSANEMEKFARSANKAAKALGTSTRDYTDASLIYFQQGLSDTEVSARTETTLKVAAVTGQSADAVSEQLTAVWNGYKVSAEESELYIDKLSAVAASTAADLEELSIGMSKVASAANIMGVDVDQLNAQLATIVSVTREAPESIGTALKTVYARMSDIEAGLDTETTLGEYTKQMAQMGINVLDTKGNLRDMGDVVEEIGNKWNNLNREQQVSLAQSIAGTRQYSRMMALFDNWDMYQEALNTSIKSTGTLSEQHATYLESIEAHQNQLKTSMEGLYDSIFNSDEIKGVYDTLSDIVTLIDELVQAMGGMPGILATVGMLFAKSAKHSIADLVSKQQANKLNNELYRAQIRNGKEIIEQQIKEIQGKTELEGHLQQILDLESKIYNNADNLTDEQWNTLQDGVRQYNEQIQLTIQLEKELQQARNDYTETFSGKTKTTTFETYTDKDGKTKERHVSTKIGKTQYWLGETEDSVTKKGAKRAGLNSAKTRKTQLEELKIIQGLTKEEEQELKLLNVRIPQAEKENKIRERKIKIEKDHTEAIKKSVTATEELGNKTNEYLDKSLSGNKFAEITENFTSITFSAIGVSSSVSSLIQTFNDSESSISDYIGGLGGLALSLTPLITLFGKAAKEGIAAGKAAGASGVFAKGAAVGWKAFAASIGPIGGIMLAVTVLTSLVTAISDAKKEAAEAAKELAKTNIEEAEIAQKTAEANAKLTQSYLNSYKEYEKTGKEKENLLTLSQQLAEAYRSEEIQNLALAGSYDELAISIRKKRIEESQNLINSAEIKQKEAKNILGDAEFSGMRSLKTTNTPYGTADAFGFHYGWTNDDNDKINSRILDESSELIEIKNGYPVVPDATKLSVDKKIQLYKDVQRAFQSNGWQPSGNINTEVQKFLANEDWKTAIETYDEAEKTLQKQTIVKQIYEEDYSAKTSLSDFASDREKLIQKYLEQNKIATRDDAAFTIDKIFSQLDSNTNQLLLRTQWLEGIKSKLSDVKTQEELQKALNLDSFGESEFSALQLIPNIEDYNQNAGSLIEAARAKAKELRYQLRQDSADDLLEASENEINRLERLEQKTIGQEKIQTIKDQNAELDKQIELLKKIQETSVKTNRANAQQQFLDLATKYGFQNDLTIDAAWNIDTIFSAIENSENLNADQKKTLEELLFGDVLKYQNEYDENNEEIIEKEEEKYQNILDEFDLRLSLKIDTADFQKEYSEFLKAFEKENNYIGLIRFDLDNFKTSLNLIKEYQEELTTINDSTELEDADKKERKEKIIKSLMEEGTNLLDIRNALEETYLNYQNAVNESYEEYVSLIESANSALEHQVALTELIYGDKAFRQMGSHYQKQVDGAKKIVDARLAQYNADKTAYEEAKAKGEGDEVLKQLEEAYLSSGESYFASLTDLATAYQEQFYNAVETSLDNLDLKIGGGRNTEDLFNELEWMQDEAEDFLNTIDAAYEVSKLARTFDSAINTTSNIKAQQRLNEVKERELAILKEKDKITKYDIERAQKQLEIEQARLALEDARDSKTKMRLMRGADGTYGYQYVADQDKITKAQQKLEDAQKSLVDLDNEELKNNLNKAKDLYSEFMSEIADMIKNGAAEEEIMKVVEAYSTRLEALGLRLSGENGILTNLQNGVTDISKLLGTDDNLLTIYPEVDSEWLKAMVSTTGEGWSTTLTTAIQGILEERKVYDQAVSGVDKTVTEATNAYYDSIMGENGLLTAQSGEIQKLADMNSKMSDVITTLGLLDDAIDKAKDAVSTYATAEGKASVIPTSWSITKDDEGNLSMTAIASAANGGYTGAWGSEGKFLLAHEKELILNKQDTANILQAVDIVRSLSESMFNTVAGIGAGSLASSAAWELAKDFIIEQTVNINAEFPNATDRSEIEAAFEELINLATQHAFEDVRGR